MELTTVNEELIKETSRFAQDVFTDYYDHLIGLDQATYMADLFLSKEAIERLIEEGAVFRILKENGEIIGFCEYQKETDRIFLSKLYAAKEHRGKGAGRFMFEDVVSYAKKNGSKNIYLTVNKHNTPSYKIYRHLGFKVIDSVVNDIGHGYVMDDYVMEYVIDE